MPALMQGQRTDLAVGGAFEVDGDRRELGEESIRRTGKQRDSALPGGLDENPTYRLRSLRKRSP